MPKRYCDVCSKTLPKRKPGTPRKYCSGKCRAKAWNIRHPRTKVSAP